MYRPLAVMGELRKCDEFEFVRFCSAAIRKSVVFRHGKYVKAAVRQGLSQLEVAICNLKFDGKMTLQNR
jgi:hypothetical protein